MPRPEVEQEKAKSATEADGQKVLASIKDGFDTQVRDFKQSLAAEVRTMCIADIGFISPHSYACTGWPRSAHFEIKRRHCRLS